MLNWHGLDPPGAGSANVCDWDVGRVMNNPEPGLEFLNSAKPRIVSRLLFWTRYVTERSAAALVVYPAKETETRAGRKDCTLKWFPVSTILVKITITASNSSETNLHCLPLDVAPADIGG